VELVLQQNGGNMDATVEQLLAMDGGGAPAPAPAPSSPPKQPSSARAWRSPLPADFLAVPPQLQALAGPPPPDAQMIADQQLAEMLQSAFWRARVPRLRAAPG
jgi:hypothetical protein